VCLADFLDEFARLAEAEAHARRFTFARNVSMPDSLAVSMDPDMITRALENLVENAFVYAKPQTRIVVAAAPVGDSIEISVENEGPGIEAEHLPHIFDPLYRAGGGPAGSGFGLGLATVKSVIRSHGWEVRAESVPGSRTAFIVTIPSTGP
jgi:signal transduction histidine kinase